MPFDIDNGRPHAECSEARTAAPRAEPRVVTTTADLRCECGGSLMRVYTGRSRQSLTCPNPTCKHFSVLYKEPTFELERGIAGVTR